MKQVSIEERAVNLAHYIIDTKDTVRGAAAKFGVSKSTVHTEESELQKYKIPQYIVLPQVFRHSTPAWVTLAVRM